MNRISILILRRIIGIISPDESRELDEWAGLSRRNSDFIDEVSSPSSLARWHERRRMINTRRPADDMRKRIEAIDSPRRSRRFTIMAMCASAAMMLLIVALAYFLYMPVAGTHTVQASVETPRHQSIDDIRSGTAAAQLNTTTGVVLALTDTTLTTREIVLAENMHPDKCPVGVDDIEQLCLTVRRGSEFKITLEDSTVVWLNADSRLIYPSMFRADERRVRVSGEAYFAVHHEPDRPFYVETGCQEIQVHGTTFNVRDYTDDNIAYTTLESGMVSVSPLGGGGAVHMSPGHQMVYGKEDEHYNMRVVNPQVVTSWRHGKFVFEEQPLKSIMHDLSRWYDFEYVFEDRDIEDIVFLGTIPRYSDFSTAVSIIEKCADLKFKVIDGKVHILRR